ncbi:TlpA family protein disulfide reductase [Deinococcus navajonensis]|uniref:TlpA family protein disulfide reductase n=1 Tax=Deinococcus navajonensis TaxID=309884 RepID=A0ABV8XRE5_9DEIO
MTHSPSAQPAPTPPGATTPTVWKRLLPPLLAAGLVAILGTALLRPAHNATTGGPLIGKTAPDFKLQSLDGAALRLSALHGRPVVVNFWASWCGPCREEAPLLRELSTKQAGGQGLAVVGVLFQEPREEAARNFIQDYALAYPHLRDPNSRTAIDYGVAGIPETFFIDAQGVVQHVDRGGLDRARLNAGLDKIGVPGL